MNRPAREEVIRLLREHVNEHQRLPESVRARDLGAARARFSATTADESSSS
jgi:hypothetical protein